MSSNRAPAAPAVKRGGWLAFLLSLVFPGAGQFSVGRPLVGLVFYLLFTVLQLVPTAAVAFFPKLVSVLAGLVPVLLGCRVLIAVHAARGYVEERRGLLAVALFVALSFGANRGAALFVRHRYVESIKIESPSMEPSLTLGDLALELKTGPRLKVERGTVVVYESEGHVLVRRVIGLPGDKVELADGLVSVNGVALGRERCAEGLYRWTYEQQRHESRCEVESIDGRAWRILVDPGSAGDGVYVVPPGSYLVLGDNRGNARDSRFAAPLPEGDVKGVIEAVWVSTGPDFPWVRFRRIGARVDEGAR